MYYLVKGNCEDEYGGGQFEWVIKADTKEAAEKDARKDLTKTDVITSIEEISVEDCIEREMQSIIKEIYRQYLIVKYDYEKMTIREYARLQKQFDNSPDEQYEAVKLAAKNALYFRWLSRVVNTKEMTLKAVYNAINLLSEATTDEQVNKIFDEIKEKNV